MKLLDLTWKEIVAVTLVAVLVVLASGCATKAYPIATPLSAAEVDLLGCDALKVEALKSEEIRRQIDTTSQFDAKSFLGILGDFGIGNAMARADAEKALDARLVSIRNAQAAKHCQ